MDSEKYKKSFYELIKSRFNREADFASIETSIEKDPEHVRNGDAPNLFFFTVYLCIPPHQPQCF
jgi:hypothetical protein